MSANTFRLLIAVVVVLVIAGVVRCDARVQPEAQAAAPAHAGPRWSSTFYTPGFAAVCFDHNGQDLQCWTPNDGFRVFVPARGRVSAPYYDRDSKGLHHLDRSSMLMLPLGGRWVSYPRKPYRCVGRRTGLTCVNRSGHGFWLGRFRGYRIF